MPKGQQIKYNQAELDWVRVNCTLSIRNLHSMFCEKFNRDDVSAINLNALRKRKGWLTGRTGQFKKGNESWNKGTHFTAGGRSSQTRFKKGSMPHNHKPIGSERVDNKDGYVWIKVAEPKKWRLKHHVVWEQNYGPIPEDKIIQFLDNDRLNLAPENLYLVTRAQNAVVNKLGLSKVHAECKPTTLSIADLKLKLRRAA